MSNDKEIIGRKQRKYKRKKSTMKIRRGRGVLCVDGENYRLIGKKNANKIRLFEQILGTKTRDGWKKKDEKCVAIKSTSSSSPQ